MNKSYSVILFLGIIAGLCYPVTWSAKWIWQNDSGPADTWMCFRKSLTLSSAPATATAHIAVDSRYWLYVNDSLVVREGGVKRPKAGTLPSMGTYYDEVDLAPFLVSGNNTIAVLVSYWGTGAGNESHFGVPMGGLLFQLEMPGRTIVSDNTWKTKVHPAYGHCPLQPGPNLPERGLFFDASKDIPDWYKAGFNETGFVPAVEKGTPPCAPWDSVNLKRPIPQWKENPPATCPDFRVITGPATVYLQLPCNMQCYPCFTLKADAPGRVLHVAISPASGMASGTEGTPLYTFYSTRGDGLEERFESPVWIGAYRLVFEVPPGVTLLDAGYMETYYNSDFTGGFECNLPEMNRLWKMGQRTDRLCMRDYTMDCPDRERAPWTDGQSSSIPHYFYALDQKAGLLGAKMFRELVYTGSGTSMGHYGELPTQTLAALGLWGLYFYYMHSGDSLIIPELYPRIRTYMTKYTLAADGLVDMSPFHDSFGAWYDWGNNPMDVRIMANALFYQALVAMKRFALMSGQPGDTSGYAALMRSVENHFNPVFWDSAVGYYHDPAHPDWRDERGVAMAVLTGLVDSAKWPLVKNTLDSVRHCGPWWERWVEEALFYMGEENIAFNRLQERYSTILARPLYAQIGTLPEHLPDGGTINHAWTGGPPILSMSQFMAGIAPDAPGYTAFHVLPKMASLNTLTAKVPSIKGDILVHADKSGGQFVLELTSPASTEALVGIPKEGYVFTSILANGIQVWNNGSYTGSVSGLVAAAQDSGYIRFRVQPGTWRFIASGTSPLVSVTASAAASLEQGAATQITAVASYASGATESDGFSYTSFDTLLATVSGAGLVTGRNLGIARIRVEKGGIADTVMITITSSTAALDSIRLSMDTLKMLTQDSVLLRVTGYYNNGFQGDVGSQVSWTSGDEGIVSVLNGLVRGVTPGGMVDVTVSLNAKSDVCRVSVAQRPSVLFRINFQREPYPPKKAGWLVDYGMPIYSGYGWGFATPQDCRNSSICASRDDRNSLNPLFQTIIAVGTSPVPYKLWVPDGRYIIRIGMGDADYGGSFVSNTTLNGDTICKTPLGTRIAVGVDTVDVVGDSGLNMMVTGTICYMVVMSADAENADLAADDGYVSPGGNTGVEKKEAPVTELALSASPNPFNPCVKISYALTPNLKATYSIFNLRGQILYRANLKSGALGEKGTLLWNGKAQASGCYFGRLVTDKGKKLNMKMLLVK